MTFIAKALAYGYGADTILNFLSTSVPTLAPLIKKAKGSGYKPLMIANFLANSLSGGGRVKGGTEAFQEVLSGERLRNTTGNLAAIGAIGLGSLLNKNQTPQQPQSGAGPTPSQPPPQQPPRQPQQAGPGPVPTSPIGPKPMSNAPVQPTPVSPAPQPNTAVAAQAIQPKTSSIIQQMGLVDRINSLQQAGNSPDVIASTVEGLLTPGQRKWLGTQQTKPFGELVKEHLNAQAIQKPQQVQPSIQSPSQELDVAKETPQRTQKGAIVATPEGIVGPIKDIRNKEALIESGGKLHKAKAEDLIESPLPEKDLADLYNEMLRGIEHETGEEISRNVNWAGYDPKTNTLAYLPHLGGLYTYEDIDPDEAKLLTNILNTRKTTGENFIGAWREGTKSPIGAAMSVLIRKLQAEAGGKGKEYSHKFETLYNALEPAMKALKNQKKKKKNG